MQHCPVWQGTAASCKVRPSLLAYYIVETTQADALSRRYLHVRVVYGLVDLLKQLVLLAASFASLQRHPQSANNPCGTA